MRTGWGLTAVAGITWAVAGCERPDHRAAAIADIRDADIAFGRATAERGADGWASFFADSGVMVIPGRNVMGRPAIRELMAPELGDTTRSLTWRPVSVEASGRGDLGYSIGRWERTVRAGTDTTRRQGSYVTIWRKQGDGTWKVVLDVGNSDPR